MVGIFLGSYDGPVQIEEHEVERIEHFSPQALADKPPDMRITSYVERSLPLILPHLTDHDVKREVTPNATLGYV